MVISQFFFVNFLDPENPKMKCQERENGVGPAAMRPVKITKNPGGCTDRHTLALGNPGSLKKRRLRRNIQVNEL